MFTVSAQFGPVLEPNEKVHWVGKPIFALYLLTGVPFLVGGLIWGLFDYVFFKAGGTFPGPFGAVLPIFLLVHAAPCWLSILNMLRLALTYRNTFYLVTDRRLILRSGFVGVDFKSVDYDKIQDLEVNVNPFEKLFAAGTVRAATATIGWNNRPERKKFVAITSPYEVFKQIKQLSSRSKENGFVI